MVVGRDLLDLLSTQILGKDSSKQTSCLINGALSSKHQYQLQILVQTSKHKNSLVTSTM